MKPNKTAALTIPSIFGVNQINDSAQANINNWKLNFQHWVDMLLAMQSLQSGHDDDLTKNFIARDGRVKNCLILMNSLLAYQSRRIKCEYDRKIKPKTDQIIYNSWLAQHRNLWNDQTCLIKPIIGLKLVWNITLHLEAHKLINITRASKAHCVDAYRNDWRIGMR